jgi:hypothetical protein
LVLDFFNKIRHPVEVNGPDIHYRIIALAVREGLGPL